MIKNKMSGSLYFLAQGNDEYLVVGAVRAPPGVVKDNHMYAFHESEMEDIGWPFSEDILRSDCPLSLTQICNATIGQAVTAFHWPTATTPIDINRDCSISSVDVRHQIFDLIMQPLWSKVDFDRYWQLISIVPDSDGSLRALGNTRSPLDDAYITNVRKYLKTDVGEVPAKVPKKKPARKKTSAKEKAVEAVSSEDLQNIVSVNELPVKENDPSPPESSVLRVENTADTFTEISPKPTPKKRVRKSRAKAKTQDVAPVGTQETPLIVPEFQTVVDASAGLAAASDVDPRLDYSESIAALPEPIQVAADMVAEVVVTPAPVKKRRHVKKVEPEPVAQADLQVNTNPEDEFAEDFVDVPVSIIEGWHESKDGTHVRAVDNTVVWCDRLGKWRVRWHEGRGLIYMDPWDFPNKAAQAMAWVEKFKPKGVWDMTRISNFNRTKGKIAHIPDE